MGEDDDLKNVTKTSQFSTSSTTLKTDGSVNSSIEAGPNLDLNCNTHVRFVGAQVRGFSGPFDMLVYFLRLLRTHFRHFFVPESEKELQQKYYVPKFSLAAKYVNPTSSQEQVLRDQIGSFLKRMQADSVVRETIVSSQRERFKEDQKRIQGTSNGTSLRSATNEIDSVALKKSSTLGNSSLGGNVVHSEAWAKAQALFGTGSSRSNTLSFVAEGQDTPLNSNSSITDGMSADDIVQVRRDPRFSRFETLYTVGDDNEDDVKAGTSSGSIDLIDLQNMKLKPNKRMYKKVKALGLSDIEKRSFEKVLLRSQSEIVAKRTKDPLLVESFSYNFRPSEILLARLGLDSDSKDRVDENDASLNFVVKPDVEGGALKFKKATEPESVVTAVSNQMGVLNSFSQAAWGATEAQQNHFNTMPSNEVGPNFNNLNSNAACSGSADNATWSQCQQLNFLSNGFHMRGFLHGSMEEFWHGNEFTSNTEGTNFHSGNFDMSMSLNYNFGNPMMETNMPVFVHYQLMTPSNLNMGNLA